MDNFKITDKHLFFTILKAKYIRVQCLKLIIIYKHSKSILILNNFRFLVLFTGSLKHSFTQKYITLSVHQDPNDLYVKAKAVIKSTDTFTTLEAELDELHYIISITKPI